MSDETNPRRGGGLPLALGAYLIWGLLPLYLREVHAVPPFEFVGWRVIFTLPVCLLLVLALRQGRSLRMAIGNRAILLRLTASALLIGGNWLVYIAAVQQGHVLATSLGYYINPLVNVLIGTLFLGERLSRAQWLAVGIAAVGVAILAWGAGEMLAISLVLALTFGGYGLVRKLTPVESLPGLTIESAVLVLPAAGIVAWQAQGPAGMALGMDPALDSLVALSGAITAAPLLLFAAAARRLDFSVLGFCQFLAPTIVFLLGLFVFHEPLRPVQMASFVLIWIAILVFSLDLLHRSRAVRARRRAG